MNKARLIQDWTDRNKPIGEEFGYPECCIHAFCQQPPQLMQGQPSQQDIMRYKAGCINGKFTGFIPCEAHARQILSGKVMLESLIRNRTIKTPFPYWNNQHFKL